MVVFQTGRSQIVRLGRRSDVRRPVLVPGLGLGVEKI